MYSFFLGPIVHHKLVVFNSVIFLTGGRNSPNSPNERLYSLKIKDVCEWEMIDLHESSDRMEPRWRHSATNFIYCGMLFVIFVISF